MSSSSRACYSLSDVSKKLKELVEGALQSLWVASAFIDRCGVELLKRIRAKGVQVRVLTSTEIDEDVLRELAEVAEVRVVKEKFMHMKLYIADGKALTGSANLTCPVLEGRNIEILCEIPLEEAVKNFNTLWKSAEEAKLKLEEFWLKVKDTPQRVIIKSRIEKELYIEIDKLLKRPVFRHDKTVKMCPKTAEVMCMRIDEHYESLVSKAIEYINSYHLDLCYWKDSVDSEINLRNYGSSSGGVSPVAFFVVGLYPVAQSMCSLKLGKELAKILNEELKKLRMDMLDKCSELFMPSLSLCLRLLEKPRVTVVYKLAPAYGCPGIDRSALEELKSLLGQALNNIKPLFEERVRKLYEEYQKKSQSYGARRIEIDGPLTAKLYIDAWGATSEYEVELGSPQL